jgi:hypothetical protein
VEDIYPRDLFIETGSFIGDGIEQALELGYKSVVSIELSEKYYNICCERFRFHPHVKIIHGDSYKVLPKVLEHVECVCTFWLDGHYSGGDTALGDYNSPLLLELESIKNHYIKSHTILIDDLRCWMKDKTHFHYEKTDVRSNQFDVTDIITKIKEINSDYKLKYLDGYVKNDVLLAHL